MFVQELGLNLHLSFCVKNTSQSDSESIKNSKGKKGEERTICFAGGDIQECEKKRMIWFSSNPPFRLKRKFVVVYVVA